MISYRGCVIYLAFLCINKEPLSLHIIYLRSSVSIIIILSFLSTSSILLFMFLLLSHIFSCFSFSGNMSYMIPNFAMMSFVGYFFSGFVCLKMPFSLPSTHFKVIEMIMVNIHVFRFKPIRCSIYLFTHLFICLFVCLFVCLID